ncbi:Inner membrane protein YhaH [Geodia barretti]|uniref:Inner membrane protein YhaH n=1 Tax=Geodia barretti TaxID=519541 RepID=A0AA35WCP3_GEOBA|nr:Inner membrane protein YhaH [Geodia barretti]
MTMPNVQQSQPSMSFFGAIKQCFSEYANFRGRASRREYWWWILALSIGWFILLALSSTGYLALLLPVFGLAVFLPTLAVTTRRLHDIDKGGWWQLIWLVLAGLAVIPTFIGLFATIASFMAGASQLLIDGFFEYLATGEKVEDKFPWKLVSPLITGVVITLLIDLAIAAWAMFWLIRRGQAGPNRHGPDPWALPAMRRVVDSSMRSPEAFE